jgi:hypothetical protein
MKLSCPGCGKPIPAENMNLDRAIAKCIGCDAVFSFADKLDGGAAIEARRQRPEAPLPRGITVDAWGSDLTITRRWFSPALFFLVFFCLFWNGFLVVWYSMLFFGPLHEEGAAVLPFLLFPLLFVAIGVFLTYFTICGFINRTVIRAGSGQLSVRHGPLPWPGNVSLFTNDVHQLYCTEDVHRGRNTTSVTYRLNLLTRDDRKIKLISGLNDADQGIFMEQKIEEHLGIKDRRVSGEMRH